MSNEPAYYEAGSYGIRIESVIHVKEVSTRRGFGDKKWFGFGRFTQVGSVCYQSPPPNACLTRSLTLTGPHSDENGRLLAALAGRDQVASQAQ